MLEESRVDRVQDTVVIREQVQFEFGKAALSSESDATLDQVANTILADDTIVQVEIQGHSDNVGDLVYNQSLSEARARAVVQALIERGVPAEKLTARGFGTQRPIGDNGTEEGRALNRRVGFEIGG